MRDANGRFLPLYFTTTDWAGVLAPTATDPNVTAPGLTVTSVRLFARTYASFTDGRKGNIGNNGSVLEVTEISGAGLKLRNAHGNEGLVKWDTLRDPVSGRLRLSYGDVLSIDATQGLTSTEHLNVMPAGTRSPSTCSPKASPVPS